MAQQLESDVADATRVVPAPVMRVAGLPVTALAALRFPDTTAELDVIVAERRWLVADGSALSDRLHTLIGSGVRPDLKLRLIGLRRAIHKLRKPARSEWNDQVRHGIPAGTRQVIGDWLSRLEWWCERCARLEQKLADEAERRADELLRAASDHCFRRALWQSSPALSRELDKWLAAPGRPGRRQVVSRLAKYVARAATKTSPYSTFTASGFGTWTSGGPAIRLATGWQPQGVLELHEGVRQPLVRAVCEEPGRWWSAQVRLNPSATVRGDQVCFLGPPPTEALVSLPLTPALGLCLELLAAEPSLSTRDLRARLAANSGAPEPQIAAFLQHLGRAGLLETRLPGSGFPGCEDVAVWLESSGSPSADAVGSLRRLATGLRTPAPVAKPRLHRIRQRSLADAIGVLSKELGTPTPEQLSPSPVTDSAVVTAPLGRCRQEAWEPVLADLDLFRRWLAVFDPTRPLQLALGELWRSWFPPGVQVPFIDLHRAVQEYLGSTAGTAAELRSLLSTPGTGLAQESSGFASVRALGQLQRDALRMVAVTGEIAGAVVLDQEQLAAGIRDWPRWVTAPTSLGYYLQVFRVAGSAPHVVVNSIDTGHGRGRSRVGHLVARAGGTPPAPTGTVPPTGPVPAELSGIHGSTFNRRSASLPFEIDYPHAESERPLAERLPLSDLRIGHDPLRRRLYLHSGRLDRPVQAVHLGMLAHPLLPPAARLLSRGFGEASLIRPDLLLLGATDSTPRGQIRPLPRVTLGRVVLRRAAWLGDASLVPTRRAGERDGAYLLRLQQWREEVGIPRQCFVRLLPPGVHRRSEVLVLRKARKPVYVDFSSWFLVTVLENMLHAPSGVAVFEEALPAPEDAERTVGVPRVVELLVEVTGRDGSDE